MSRMFSERIRQFVLSNDIMDQDTFYDLLKLVHAYVHKYLDIIYFSVLVETVVDEDQLGLKTEWTTREEGSSYTVGSDKEYISVVAYAFGENKPVWVVADSKGILQDETDLKDLWAQAEDLPGRHSKSQESVRTSIMHPLRREGRAVGVLEFAAEKYLEPTPVSRDEIKTLATVISRAYQMYDVRKDQRENSRKAIQMLEKALSGEEWARLELPRMFVAYAGGGRLDEATREEHEAVIQSMRKVVGGFEDALEVTYWEDVTEAGNINDQVIRDISGADFGLCYLSQPKGKGRFEDNANVLFEAGMMQALTKSPSALLKGWIPIREDAEGVPFDIASERLLLVDRKEGQLDKEAFMGALRKRLESLVDSGESPI